MVVAVDTDVLVNWAVDGAPRHAVCRAFVADHVAAGGRLAVTAQVLYEFVHVVTDPRRFDPPMTMAEASVVARRWWDAAETVRIVPSAARVHRALDLLNRHQLERKRILDTALAAALEEAGVTRIATFNGCDFARLGVIEVVSPGIT